MTNHKIPAYSLIFNYLLECTNITFKTSQYIAGQSIPGLNLGLSTVKKIRAGKEMSETSANKIANTFSLKLRHPKERRILRDDLDLSLDAFKKIFPPGAFIQEHSDADYVNMSLFTNKLYRGYYITPNSPHSVYMAYFKLFEKNGCNGVQREHDKIKQWTANLTQRYRPNETRGGIFVSWQERRNHLPEGLITNQSLF